MNSVAIFLITHNNPIETAYFLDNLFENTRHQFTLYIYDFFGDENQEMKNMLITATNKTKGQYTQVQSQRPSLAQIYNSMLNGMTEDYGVFLSINFILNKNWLNDLIYYNQFIKNSGCSSVSSDFHNTKLTSALFEDETQGEPIMKTIWVNDTNTLNEFLFFSKEQASKIGFVDTTFKNRGLELAEWSFRFINAGLFNYYIGQNSVIKYVIDDEILFPKITQDGKDELKNKLNLLAKQKNKIKNG